MRTRPTAAALATAGLIASLGIVTSSPASAANLGAYDGCVGGDIVWEAGDRVTVVLDDEECVAISVATSGNVAYERRTVDLDDCWTFTNLGGAGIRAFVGSERIADNQIARTNVRDTGTTTALATVCGDPVLPTATASDETPPSIPAWVQAYGRASADATCLDGWNQSWQSWAEPVTGGWVCTRNIPSLG